MKIAIISNSAFNIYNFRLSLAKKIRESGYEVFFVAPYDEYTPKIVENGFYIEDIYINPKGSNIIEDKNTIDDFKRAFKKTNPSLILNFTIKPNIYATLAASFLNIPAINTVTGLGTVFIKEDFVTNVVSILYRVSFKKARKIFFQNEEDRKFFIERKIVTEENSAIVPGSGVDTDRFHPMEKKKYKDKFVFLFIGRMLFDKGIKEYIEAAKIIKKKYKNVEFCLLGPLDVENKTIVSKRNMYDWVIDGAVTYLGSSLKVEEFIRNSDCVVLPSYREGLPKSLLEAGAMEKPLIATNVTGCRDVVIDGENGFLCEAKSVESLVLACEKMLNLKEEKRLCMGKKARELVIKKFDERIVINTYLGEVLNIVPLNLRFRFKYGMSDNSSYKIC